MIDYIGAPRSTKMRTTRSPRPMMPWPASRLSGRNCDGAGFRATPRLLIRYIGNDDGSGSTMRQLLRDPSPTANADDDGRSTPVSGPILTQSGIFSYGATTDLSWHALWAAWGQ
jgi:hypothetical protein